MRVRSIAAAAALSLAGACAHGDRTEEQARRTDERASRSDRPRGGERGSTARIERGGKEEGMKPRAGAPRVPASPEGLLGRDTVVKLQQALAQRGLLRQHRQGELDASTSAAVKRFQRQRGLAATGMPDRETLRDLGVSADEAYGTASGGG